MSGGGCDWPMGGLKKLGDRTTFQGSSVIGHSLGPVCGPQGEDR